MRSFPRRAGNAARRRAIVAIGLAASIAAACGGNHSPTAPMPPSDSGSGFAVTSAQFDQMFPGRNRFYTYADLAAAAQSYPAFAGTGSADTRKQEMAAFLGNVAHETGRLVYIEQIAKADYCDATNTRYPCAAGKQYYGRGPLQLSWNYNYGAAGDALGRPLLASPEMVAQVPTIAWQTALWFWMTQAGAGTMTPHDAMVGGAGFGQTIRSINGALECGGGNPA